MRNSISSVSFALSLLSSSIAFAQTGGMIECGVLLGDSAYIQQFPRGLIEDGSVLVRAMKEFDAATGANGRQVLRDAVAILLDTPTSASNGFLPSASSNLELRSLTAAELHVMDAIAATPLRLSNTWRLMRGLGNQHYREVKELKSRLDTARARRRLIEFYSAVTVTPKNGSPVHVRGYSPVAASHVSETHESLSNGIFNVTEGFSMYSVLVPPTSVEFANQNRRFEYPQRGIRRRITADHSELFGGDQQGQVSPFSCVMEVWAGLVQGRIIETIRSQDGEWWVGIDEIYSHDRILVRLGTENNPVRAAISNPL